MSAADRMVVRTRNGVRSVPRRVGLAMIATRRARRVTDADTNEAIARVVSVRDQRTAHVHIEPAGDVDDQVRGPVAFTGHVDLADVDVDESVDVPGFEEDVTALPIVAPAVEQPKGNAGRDAWVHYAQAHGVRVTDDMGRNEVRDAVVAKLESDRMSRPAFEGGRPATPEDEPVTESAVTDADPGERTP